MTETRANPSRYNHIPVRLSETSPKIDRYDFTRLDILQDSSQEGFVLQINVVELR